MKTKEKKQRNKHLLNKKSIKVQALRNGFFDYQKIIEGQIFEIKERKGKQRITRYSDYTEDIIVTVADQFSKFWMIELKNEGGLDANDEAQNKVLIEAKAKEDKLRAKDSEKSLATLTNKPEVKKATEKEPVKEPDGEEVI